MRSAVLLTLLAPMLASPSEALANVEVRFLETSPRDRFTITNIGSCDLAEVAITIDLSGSPYGLVFDIERGGPGYNIAHPFRIAFGREYLTSVPTVMDGDNRVTLDFEWLPANASVAFTVDTDDTRPNQPTQVSSQEILGATIAVQLPASTVVANFRRDGRAIAELSACVS